MFPLRVRVVTTSGGRWRVVQQRHLAAYLESMAVQNRNKACMAGGWALVLVALDILRRQRGGGKREK